MNQPPRSARPVAASAIPPAVVLRPVVALPPVAAVVQQREVTQTSNGDQLEKQLDAIIRTTTVEDLAKRGGQLKTVKERDLRELIRQSLLQLLQSSTAISAGEQERILDQVQSELKRSMGARATEQAEHLALTTENQALHGRLAQLEREHGDRAGEVGQLRALLAEAEAQAHALRAELERGQLAAKPLAGPERWAKVVDETWFAGRHRREVERRGTDHAETLADALQGHLATCTQLLADYPASPPGADASGDVLARLRALLALRTRDQSWISELQGRSATLLTDRSTLQHERDTLVLERDALRAERASLVLERDDARSAVDGELQRTIELETQIEELDQQLANGQAGLGQAALSVSDSSVESELAEVRDRLSDTLSRLEDAARVKSRLEQELATTAGIRAAAEHRTTIAQAQVTEAETRVRELQTQLGDQRRTTDLARRASVEAEALRGEVEGLRTLLAEREQVLAGEREKYHQERDKHRADTTTRLEAIRRFEQALLALKDQLSERERQLAEAQSELEVLRAAPPAAAVVVTAAGPARSAEIAALVAELANSRGTAAAANAARDHAERAQRLAEAERRALTAHQADAVRLQQELDQLRAALATAEARAARTAAERDVAMARASAPAAPAPAVATPVVDERELASARGALAEAHLACQQALAAQAQAETARRLAEAELAGALAHQADSAAVQQERDRLFAALREADRAAGAATLEPRLSQLATGIDELRDRPAPQLPASMPTDLGPIERELAKIRALLAAMQLAPAPAPVPASVPVAVAPASAAMPTLAPPAVVVTPAPVPLAAPAAPAAATPPKIESKPERKRRALPARLAGPACLGDDGRARYTYLRGTTPRLVVHGATWHHQGVAANSAAPGATPVIVVDNGVSWVVYRDRSGALHRAGPDAREQLLPEGSASGDPAILVDPAKERWLIAVRDAQGAVRIHALAASGATTIGSVHDALGDPAWWSGERDAPHRLCVPTGGAGVAIHAEGDAGWSRTGETTLAPAVTSIEALAVAGRGAEAVLAVRSTDGVVAAQRTRPDGTWDAPAVLDASGAPAVGRLAAAQGDGEALVAYRASDGLLQIMLHRGQWRHLAFGSNFNAPAVASDPQLLLHEGLVRCFYQGTDGHIHEVRNSSAGWNAYDLSVLTRDL